MKELQEEEAAEAAARLADARKLKQYQLHQASTKARRAAVEKTAQLQEAAYTQADMEQQDAVFDEYATSCLDHYKLQGKTTVPMERLLTQRKGFEVLI